MEEAGSVEEKTHAKKTIPELQLLFVETALQLLTKGERKEKKNINRLISDTNSDAVELHRQMKNVHDCKQILDNSRSDCLAGKNFTTMF